MRILKFSLVLCTAFGASVSLVHSDEPIPVQKPAVIQLIQNQKLIQRQKPKEAEAAGDQTAQDKKILDQVGLKPDAKADLVAYLKSRVLNDDDLAKIQKMIAKLGVEDFDTRISATEELTKMGPPVVAPLRLASKDDSNNAELIYRCEEILAKIEKVSQAEVAAAAIRSLAKSSDPEVLEVLLSYLPLADNVFITSTIEEILKQNAVKDGKANPTLVEALQDKNPIRRVAASLALIKGGATLKDRKIAEVYPKLLEAARTEPDLQAKFKMTKELLVQAQDPVAVDMLLSLLPDLNHGQIWQAEDLLCQLGGDKAPKERCHFGNKTATLAAQKAWQDWWEKSKQTIDIAKLNIKPRIEGYFVTVTNDYRFGSDGSVTEFGTDDKPRWELNNLKYPMDIDFLPNGHLVVAEQGTSSITERDLTGKVFSTNRVTVNNPGGGKLTTQPQNLQRLKDGNLLVICRNAIVIYDPKWKEIATYVRPNNPNFGNYDICAATMLSSGEIAVCVQNNGNNGQNPQIIFLDQKLKEIPKREIKIGTPNYQGFMVESGKDRVLLTESNQIVEMDIKTGKQLWKRSANQPRTVQRLPNNNLIYSEPYPAKVTEITESGEVVWSYTIPDNSQNSIQLLRALVR